MEAVSAQDLEAHARFLLGEGPKPEQKAQEQPGVKEKEAGAAGPSEPIHVTDGTFSSVVLQSLRPVLVDFWAPWCGPCRITNPMMERLAREQAGKIIVAKVNVDENPRSAGRYGVQSIPTMLVVKGGVVVDQWSGALPEPALRSRLASILS
jgi:thioredoxin 1